MHIIRTWAQLAQWPQDDDIGRLLQERHKQLAEYGDLEHLGTFIIVQQGDTYPDVEQAAGFPIVSDDTPNWEWIERHGSIFEAPIILTDDGFGRILIIPDDPSTDPHLLALCRKYT